MILTFLAILVHEPRLYINMSAFLVVYCYFDIKVEVDKDRARLPEDILFAESHFIAPACLSLITKLSSEISQGNR